MASSVLDVLSCRTVHHDQKADELSTPAAHTHASVIFKLHDKLVEIFSRNRTYGACLLASQMLCEGIRIACGAYGVTCYLRQGFSASADKVVGWRHYWVDVGGQAIDVSSAILDALNAAGASGESTPPTVLATTLPATTTRLDLQTEEDRLGVAGVEKGYATLQIHGPATLWREAPPHITAMHTEFIAFAVALKTPPQPDRLKHDNLHDFAASYQLNSPTTGNNTHT